MELYKVTAQSFIAGSIRQVGSIVREDEFTGPVPAHFERIETSTSENVADQQVDGDSTDSTGESDVNATIAATELAEKHGIDITTVTGTGRDGAVKKEDVQAAIDAQAS